MDLGTMRTCTGCVPARLHCIAPTLCYGYPPVQFLTLPLRLFSGAADTSGWLHRAGLGP